MRPLNRPMFRYGGPIKEGVMSGIREPKKNGGLSKQFGTGLVGDERYPKTGGREHHLAVLPFLGLNALRQGAMRLGSRYLMPLLRKQVGTQTVTKQGPSQVIKGGTKWSKGYPGGKVTDKIIGPGTVEVPKYGPTWLGRDPLVQGAGWGYKALTSPGMQGMGAKALRFATSPSIVLPGGFFYLKGKWWDKNNNPAKPEDIAAAKASTGGPPGGGDQGMQGTGEWFAAQAEKEALAKKQKDWNNRIQKYRDIMDIKGMNKQAAYKSLVDASKLIQESGDFKGDIKSGKLINQVIQAASKQFDKPAKTSDAINTLILQNELKKDLSAETDALDKEYKRSAIAINEKKLAGTSLNEEIGVFRNKHGKNPSGAKLEGILLDKDVNVVDVADTVQVDKHIKNGGDEVSFMESIVEANVKEGKSVTPGVYVVKDKIIIIDENGQVKKKR